MCVGVEIIDRRGNARQIMFDDPGAQLPLITKKENIAWVAWGVRSNLELRSPLSMPHTGWLLLRYIAAGKVRRWHPKPVHIQVDKFMVMTREREPLWVQLGADMAIQGALIRSDQEEGMRVYVVTEPPPPEYSQAREHWPRIVRYAERDKVITI